MLSLGVMAPELAKDEKIHEREIDPGIVTRLITSMIFQLAKTPFLPNTQLLPNFILKNFKSKFGIF